MNNKLLEILEEFDKLTLGYCDNDELDEISYIAGQAHFKEYYKKFLKKKLVEYARSKVPKKRVLRTASDGYTRDEYVIHTFIDDMNYRIDQDIHSLTDTK